MNQTSTADLHEAGAYPFEGPGKRLLRMQGFDEVGVLAVAYRAAG